MILGYESLRSKINKASGENCKNVILATYSKHFILLLLFVCFFTQFSFMMLLSSYRVFFLTMYVVIMLLILFVLITNRVGIGINDSRLVYVKFSRIGFRSKKVYAMDLDKIKYLDVKKFLGNTSVKMSFIDGAGKLRRINFRYTKMVFGISSSDQCKSGDIIRNKLIEIQKVLDRGDF